MKGRIIIFSTFLLLSSNSILAQNKNMPQSIISTTASIRGYHSQNELQNMQKGELLELYIERIKVLVKTLPYIALATRPGVTIADLGIPDDSKNRKIMDVQKESTSSFLENTVEFQRSMMPYSDKNILVASILFYESTLKSLHELENL
jgi:hypothetical protein